MVRTLLLTFIPLFVAVDVVALVLVYLGIGMPLDEASRQRLVLEATMTAAAVGIGFLLVGDLLHPELPLRQPGAHPGVVPLGIPMIVGPPVLTTLLTVGRTYGYTMTLIAFALNLVIVWVALRWASLIGRVLGDAGCRAITKVFSLLLAAIAVTFTRRGMMTALTKP